MKEFFIVLLVGAVIVFAGLYVENFLLPALPGES